VATQKRLVAAGVPEHNAPVAGCVMMDFLREGFAGYYDDKESLCARHGLDAKRPLWLYISSFGYASMPEDEVRELSDMAGTDFSEFARVNRESMAETLRWFEQYLTGHPEVQLVYRRHPSEWNSPALLELEARLPNFHVIFEDSVKQWIVAADTITIWMSSAIAEVYFAQKSCHILRPQPIPHEFDPVIYKDAAYVTSYERFCDAAGHQNPPFPIAPDVIDAYFDEDASAPAYKRMADLLENILKNPPRGTPFDADFKPRFNGLKCFALWGIHILHALRLNPARFKKIAPRFAAFAGRIYGYVDKAHRTKTEIKAMRDKITPFVHKREDSPYE
jgi:hypothetical protein